MSADLPTGWERIDEAAPYVKLVKRDAVTVPKRHAGGEPFSRDAVGNVYGVKCRECGRTHELNPDVQRGI